MDISGARAGRGNGEGLRSTTAVIAPLAAEPVFVLTLRDRVAIALAMGPILRITAALGADMFEKMQLHHIPGANLFEHQGPQRKRNAPCAYLFAKSTNASTSRGLA